MSAFFIIIIIIIIIVLKDGLMFSIDIVVEGGRQLSLGIQFIFFC